MRIDAIELLHISIPLVGPFRISRGVITHRHMLLVKLHSGGAHGWAEAGADLLPLYTYETVGTVRHVISDLLAPELMAESWPDDGAPRAVAAHLSRWPWHPMAKAAVEEAFWDLEARRKGMPVHKLYAGDRPVRDRVEVGISLGIQDDFGVLEAQIDDALAQGYRRIKLKIAAGHDHDVLRNVRNRFGDIPLMVDANCGYTERDMDLLAGLDDYDLIMLEQPFEYDELEQHARLQERIKTPVCLDESAKTPEITAKALDMGAAQIINIKCSRLGGRTAGIDVHDLCEERGIPVWCGGMLEAGIGRLHNIAVATLPNFKLSNDLSASRRYWERDIIDPEVELDDDGNVVVPHEPGIGYAVRDDLVERYLVDREVIR
ncbi:MAG: o-succinylbenzoate synthase [Acidobacteria bacterium]|nr:o-succinylbenzoate synthase [Acidobacteriota bacterium]